MGLVWVDGMTFRLTNRLTRPTYRSSALGGATVLVSTLGEPMALKPLERRP